MVQGLLSQAGPCVPLGFEVLSRLRSCLLNSHTPICSCFLPLSSPAIWSLIHTAENLEAVLEVQPCYLWMKKPACAFNTHDHPGTPWQRSFSVVTFQPKRSSSQGLRRLWACHRPSSIVFFKLKFKDLMESLIYFSGENNFQSNSSHHYYIKNVSKKVFLLRIWGDHPPQL